MPIIQSRKLDAEKIQSIGLGGYGMSSGDGWRMKSDTIGVVKWGERGEKLYAKKLNMGL